MRGGTHRCWSTQRFDWDGVLLRQYKRNVLSWRLKGFSGEESGIHKRLRLSTKHIWDYREYFKRKLVYLFGKRNRKGLGIGVILGYTVHSLSAREIIKGTVVFF